MIWPNRARMVPRRSRREDHDRHSWIWNEPRWRTRLSCSSGMITGRNVSSSAVYSFFISFSSRTESTFRILHEPWNTVGRRTNTGTRQERTSSSPRINFNFSSLLRSNVSTTLRPTSGVWIKVLILYYSRSLTPSFFYGCQIADAV